MSYFVGLILSAVVMWGLADFLGKPAATRLGPIPTLLFSQVGGLVLTLVLWPLAGEVFPTDPRVLAAVVFLALLNTVGFFALFKALTIGKLSVVAPIVSTNPAITVVLAALIAHETLPILAWGALSMVLAGIAVTAKASVERGTRGNGSFPWGVALALVPFVTLGVISFSMKYLVFLAGPVAVVLAFRAVASGAVLPAYLSQSAAPPLRARPLVTLALPIGVLDTLGFVAFNLCLLLGPVSVASTVGGLYVAVTLVLARWKLGERLRRGQLVGVVLALAATVFLLAST